MGWFKRLSGGIQTTTKDKKEVPDGFWQKCKACGGAFTIIALENDLFVCPKCESHLRIGSHDYFKILFGARYKLLFEDLKSYNFLDFTDVKSYDDRLKKAQEQTSLSDAISVASGMIRKKPLIIAAMDFTFIGGSMGSVVGEKISRAVDHCIKKRIPLMIISKSGGARMMESAFSLMQLAKTSAKLSQLAKAKLPFFSFLTDPTTGGVTASFAMLGDINFAEPKALIGFAGPRVIKETIKKDLPEGFQTSEFLFDHGFLDFIVERKNLKKKLDELLSYFHSLEAQ
ncbi:MAG: acetyl-CoA carboxylase carboxyl transferase subunit beta [Saprospiraceae bacterium]|jgi:acetyl-CoA carboxylase carboxyl transferase subunit beta